MTFIEVTKDDNRQLQNVANALTAARKVIVVTGAGISTNCGIPVCLKALSLLEPDADPLSRIFVRRKACTRSYKPNEIQLVQKGL